MQFRSNEFLDQKLSVAPVCYIGLQDRQADANFTLFTALKKHPYIAGYSAIGRRRRSAIDDNTDRSSFFLGFVWNFRHFLDFGGPDFLKFRVLNKF